MIIVARIILLKKRQNPILKKQKPRKFYLARLESGGGERSRTADLLSANQTLYQLSYTPRIWESSSLCKKRLKKLIGGPKSTRTTDLPVISGVL